jgi:hypothetical protein
LAPLPDGEGDGLIGLPDVPPAAPLEAPLFASCMHFSRSVPVIAAHLAGTSLELPLAPLLPGVPLEPDC